MVVDDDPDILYIIQRALRKWDLSSDGFTDPAGALDHFRSNYRLYSLVISDMRMPGMSGFQFIEKVTRIKPAVKIVILTAYFRDMLDIPEVLKGIVKVDTVLEKPIGIKKVCEKVRAQLAAS